MTAWIRDLLAAAGLDAPAASSVSANLEYAERRGFVSHGFMRLPTYLDRIQAGGINTRPVITVLSDHPGLAIVNADAAAGALSATKCVEMVIEKARNTGVGVVIAREANHFGAAGYYTDLLAKAGLFGIAVCNTDAVMCAPFGGRAVLGTNPLSMAVPGPGRGGPQLDMASSEASYGKILVARDSGATIPLGWGVDASGVPTTDPGAALAGALLPSGGPKGFGIAFMADCLVAIAGAQTSNEVSPLYGDASLAQQLGHFFMAVEVDHVQTFHDYVSRVAALTDAVHDSATAGSTRPPMVPGEPEMGRLMKAEAWVIDEFTVHRLMAASDELAVELPAVFAAEQGREG